MSSEPLVPVAQSGQRAMKDDGPVRRGARVSGRVGSALDRALDYVVRYREQLLYLVVGGWNTVFGYGVWAVMQYLLGDHIPYLVIVVMAWPIAVLNAYIGYRYLVFRSRGPILTELPRFSLVYAVTLVVNLALLPIALHVLPFNIYIVQALLTVVVIVASYLSHKYFTFSRRSQ